MQKDKKYLMHYIKPENKLITKKNGFIALSIFIIITALLLIFNLSKNKKEITVKDKKIIIEKNEKSVKDIKRGEFKKEETTINNQKYIKYIYVVQKNDTLAKIAKKFLSDAYKWHDIQKYNENIKNPHWIIVDQQIIIYIPAEN